MGTALQYRRGHIEDYIRNVTGSDHNVWAGSWFAWWVGLVAVPRWGPRSRFMGGFVGQRGTRYLSWAGSLPLVAVLVLTSGICQVLGKRVCSEGRFDLPHGFSALGEQALVLGGELCQDQSGRTGSGAVKVYAAGAVAMASTRHWRTRGARTLVGTWASAKVFLADVGTDEYVEPVLVHGSFFKDSFWSLGRA